ncbi:histone H2A deubiquitinase MYSM1 [Salarias fasciatus]|uniref:Myb-like, SWIRM and MPN domain-containing protein 1 n=1 Tax=Salarias fasciatus TaxID=181472 RepID=A0A672FP05_SALFA|nr:histone H2A deubiquitinase MYSM1 [Salarias fasciatus]
MEEEVEVDVEGDDGDGVVREVNSEKLVQEQLVQQSGSWILPWELDTSISAENREVIENMLLEEQYLLTDVHTETCILDRLQEEVLPPSVTHESTVTTVIQSETLSDDEEVDIIETPSDAGEGDDDGSQFGAVPTTDEPKEKTKSQSRPAEEDLMSLNGAEGINRTKVQLSHNSVPSQSLQPSTSLAHSEETGEKEEDKVNKTEFDFQERPEMQLQAESKQKTEDEFQNSNDNISGQADQLQDSCSAGTEKSQDQDKEEKEDEETELRAPEQELKMDLETITEDEKQTIPEFFEGRPSKTPERYMKIRNYIIEQWLKRKPMYLNKTAVRPGLKNCGDVNCIGKIHTYLELIGAINFSCEQAVYNRPKSVDVSKHKKSKDVFEAYQLQSSRTRKRRVRDGWGNWCDAKDLEGQTFEHLSPEELALRREEMIKCQPKLNKMSRYQGSVDPFQLIPCRTFEEDVPEPFQVVVCAETLLIMDMHAHVSQSEVIGLLGGTFSEDENVLKVCAAEPCNSVSTGLQCEMDPVSQTQACDMLASLGFSVVGWYHSHPSFHPNPSVRDINTQDQFQSYFSRGGAPFIGMIVSPYDRANSSPHSQTTCLFVRESEEPSGPLKKLPYRFNFLPSQDIPDWEQMMRRAQWIIHKYAKAPRSVKMNKLFRQDSHLTCLEKMLSSLRRYMKPLPEQEGDLFLAQIQILFQTDFISKQQSLNQEEDDSLKTSSKPVDLDDLPLDRVISQERSRDEGADSKTNSDTVLHLGSVLPKEHKLL